FFFFSSRRRHTRFSRDWFRRVLFRSQYCEETIFMRIRNVASLLAETLEEYAQGQGSVAPVPLGWALACFWGGGNFIMWRREAARSEERRVGKEGSAARQTQR